MRHPQIVLFETDGVLAATLGELASQRRWLLRESRQAPACLHLLRGGGVSVLVVKLGRHLVRELTLIDEVRDALPDVPVVGVGDTEDAGLMMLALELGARFVLQPPQPRQQLVAIVDALMLTQLPPIPVAAAEAPCESES